MLVLVATVVVFEHAVVEPGDMIVLDDDDDSETTVSEEEELLLVFSL